MSRLAAGLATLALITPMATPSATQASTPAITVTVGCLSNPETTRIHNNRSYTITIKTVGSIYHPYSYEPFTVNYKLAGGKTITYQTGRAATTHVLTTSYIYDNNVGTREGAKVVTSAGTFYDRCG